MLVVLYVFEGFFFINQYIIYIYFAYILSVLCYIIYIWLI